MFKLRVGYPNKAEEREIMRRMSRGVAPRVEPVLSVDDIMAARALADQIQIQPEVESYIVEIVFATREPRVYKLEHLEPLIEYGASPRACIFIHRAARVHAMLAGRTYVNPQDIKEVGPDVLRHRILLSYEAEARDMSSDDILREIFSTVDVP